MIDLTLFAAHTDLSIIIVELNKAIKMKRERPIEMKWNEIKRKIKERNKIIAIEQREKKQNKCHYSIHHQAT